MSNNKAREINSPVIKQLLDETNPEELAKIDAEMTNNKQQTAVEWLQSMELERDLTLADWKQAKEMEIAGKEMSYSDGYAQGYQRALDYMTMSIKNAIETRKP
jgi:hypothetical protein